MNNYPAAVVIDNGSAVLKAGLAGNREPQFTYANITGRGKGKAGASESSQRDLFVGEEAQARRCSLSISYPVERGLVTSWTDMEAMWKNVYENNLKRKAYESPVMLTEPALNPLANRERMTELFFESFEVPALYVSIQPVLALFASGYTTGYVLDSGAGVSQCVPIFEGYCLPHGVLRLDLAGRDLTEYLIKLLQEHGVMLLSQSDKKVVTNIKENHCYVAVNFEEELTKNPSMLEKTYKLPDGKTIKLHDEMFRCPESLFLPGHLNLEAPGIDKLCFNSIMKCDTDLRSNFFSNIILAGGSTCFPGLDKRLVKELALMVPANTSVRVSAPPDRKISVWMGGSILASLSAFQDMWITTAEFKEVGANIVHQRCF